MKKVAVLLIFAMVCLIAFGSVQGPVLADEVNWDDYRIAGANRYETAYEIAKVFNADADRVLIVRGDEEDEMPQIVDGLTASALAGLWDAPILLVQQDRLPPDTLAALESIDPSEAYIIGGLNAIEQSVEDAIAALDIETRRIAGDNRYETAGEIAMEFEAAEGNIALITNGNDENLVDSLTAGPLAFMGHPILLVNTLRGEVPDATLDAIDELGVEELIIIGGPSAVSTDIEDTLNAIDGVSVLPRLAGANRYETSVAVANFAPFADNDLAYLVNGFGTRFVDAVAASTLGAPIVYFNGNREEIPQSVINHLRNLENFMAIGGNMVAPDSILQRAKEVTGVPLIAPRVQTVFGMDLITSEYWLPNSEVDIEIEGEEGTVFSHSVTADEEGGFQLYFSETDTEYQLQGGDLLTMTDNMERQLSYEILFIDVTEVDTEENTVMGMADPNQEVEVYIDTSEQGDDYDDMPRLTVTANDEGEWTADFTDQFEMGDDLYGGALVMNEEGNGSIFYWGTATPQVTIYPQEDNITGFGWGDQVTLTINDTITFTVDTDGGWFDVKGHGDQELILQSGQEILITDGITTYTFEVAALEILAVNRAAGEISGTAEADTEVLLDISTPWMQPGGGPPIEVLKETLTVDAQGEWSFSGDPIDVNDDIYVIVESEDYGELVRTVDRDLGEYSGSAE
ncbi:cell wall-binding repeat-containing protein [Isachenkonia alkalipeptolytica]|nr:cell wall-binding repeat-containing protein [Isachenkonia alkalipeptolytica]